MRRPLLALVSCLAVATATAVPAAGQQVPPPTPVPPSGSPSPFPTALETPRPSGTPPELTAASAALVDLDTGRILFERNADDRRPVASTTKIVTALLVLEASEADDRVTVSANAAAQEGATIGLEAGERISVRELLHGLLLSSANDASVALAEHVAGDVEAFVDRMNELAEELGLRDSNFRSPGGLDDRGYSTARDLSAITVEAYRNPTFAEVVGRKFRRVPAPSGPPRRIQNRNALLWLYPDAIGVKTGYTSTAGFCLVSAAERGSVRLLGVVLDSSEEAFSDSAALLDYGFTAFDRRTVVARGQAFAPLTVAGVEVPVVAGRSFDLLLGEGEDVEERVHTRPDLSLPLEEGERTGRVVLRLGGERVGAVPLVTAEEVASERSEPGSSWWEAAWDEVSGFFVDLFVAILG